MGLDWVKIITLIGVLLTFIGVVLSWLTFRGKAKNIETKIETMSIHNQYQSPGIVNNYFLNQAPMNENQIKGEYEQTNNKGISDE